MVKYPILSSKDFEKASMTSWKLTDSGNTNYQVGWWGFLFFYHSCEQRRRCDRYAAIFYSAHHSVVTNIIPQ